MNWTAFTLCVYLKLHTTPANVKCSFYVAKNLILILLQLLILQFFDFNLLIILYQIIGTHERAIK